MHVQEYMMFQNFLGSAHNNFYFPSPNKNTVYCYVFTLTNCRGPLAQHGSCSTLAFFFVLIV